MVGRRIGEMAKPSLEPIVPLPPLAGDQLALPLWLLEGVLTHSSRSDGSVIRVHPCPWVEAFGGIHHALSLLEEPSPFPMAADSPWGSISLLVPALLYP